MQSSNSYVGLSRVPTRLLIVGGMHVVVVWALINGLHVHLTTAAQPTDIVASMIDTVKPPPERFMPPDVPQTKVKLTDEPPVVPVLTEDKVDVGSMITESPVEDTYVAPTGWTADPEPVITGAAVDPRHPLTQPDYPMSSVHLDEQGKVVLSVLIGTDGRVTDVKVAQSSGSSRLDQAAVTEARAHWRLRPATRNGVPFEQWLTLGVVFRLENR
jgi:protein TonB